MNGQIALADLDIFIQNYANICADPGYMHVSLQMMRQLAHLERIGRLYRVHPAPPRKIRKCHMRKLQTTWKRGKQRIARIERNEARREAEMMQRIREG